MKKIVAGLICSLVLSAAACTPEVPKVEERKEERREVRTEKVCIKVYNAKLDKEEEKCRVIKIHEKYEGKKINQ